MRRPRDCSPDEMVVVIVRHRFGNRCPGDAAAAPLPPAIGALRGKLTQNPRLIGKRPAKSSGSPLMKRFRRRLRSPPAETSPLMENLQAISVMPPLAAGNTQDLPNDWLSFRISIHNSGNLALYDGVPTTWRRADGPAAHSRRLDEGAGGALVGARDKNENLGAFDGTDRFWRRWFEDQAGTLDRITKISD